MDRAVDLRRTLVALLDEKEAKGRSPKLDVPDAGGYDMQGYGVPPAATVTLTFCTVLSIG